MTTRKYSSRAQQTTLTSGITSGDTTMTVGSGANLMGGKTPAVGETYTVVIDPDTALEEIVDISNYASGNTLTIVRGIDGSTGVAHSAGAIVRHMVIGRDLTEANTHIEATTGHGATGAVVGTTNTQTLTNKTLTSPTITGTGAIAGTFTGNLTGNVTGTVSGNAGTVTNGVYTTDTGTVTSTMIANGTIVNADINSAAAIDKTKISGTAVTLSDTGTVTGTMIANDTIVNADINSSAQIAYSKTNLTNSIVNADINASAAIEWTKIAPSSTVSATELGYLDGVTSAVQTQIDSKLATATASSTYAPLASPALTGTPTAPTATAGTNTTQVATTAFVKSAVDNVVAAAPGALDTLNELAAALGNDASFSTTVTNSLATKLPLAGGTMSGAIAMGTNKVTGLGTPTTSTDAATKGYVDGVTIAPSNLTGPITSVGAATTVAAQTGTGSTFVMQTSPTLTTPVLGVATATSINGTTIPSSKTLVATDSTTYVVPSQTGNASKFLTTDGTTSSWGNVAGALAQPTEPSSPQDGQIWIDTDGTAPTTVVTRWTKQPAAGTTSLTGNDDYSIPLAYSAGYEQVFLNGVLLSRSGGEYTATSGTAITLASATVASDIVEVICPLQIATTDTYTQSAVNNAFQANTNNFAAGKNGIINGNMDIWQRGTSSSGNAYIADRWYSALVSGTGTFAQESTVVPAGSLYSQKFTASATAQPALYQAIETQNAIKYANQNVTVSAKVASSTSVGFTADVQYSTSTDNGVTGTWTSITATSGGTATATSTTFVSISGVYAIPSTAKSLRVRLFTTSTIASSVVVYFDQIQLEAGSVATAFQTATGTIQGELAACQRYYQRLDAANNSAQMAIGPAWAFNANGADMVYKLTTEMRVAPTTLDYSSLSHFQWQGITVNSVPTSIVYDTNINSRYNAGVTFNKTSGYTSGGNYFILVNSSSAYIGFGAEL